MNLLIMSSSESTTNEKILYENNLKKLHKAHAKTLWKEKQQRYRARKTASQTHKTFVQLSKKKRTESPVVATCSAISNISFKILSILKACSIYKTGNSLYKCKKNYYKLSIYLYETYKIKKR